MNNTKRSFALLVALSVGGLITGCSEDRPATSPTATVVKPTVGAGERWYAGDRVERGAITYVQYCASCHGPGAEGSFSWRQSGTDGKYPPPPLDGTGHAWHHPIKALGYQVKFGAP